MNEIRLARGLESPKAEVESHDSRDTWFVPAGEQDPALLEPTNPEAFPHYEADGPAADRRVAQRYSATQGRCWIGWHEAGRFRQSAGWILNISVSGSLVALDTPPPTDGSIWIRPDHPEVLDWAEAKVLTLHPSTSGFFAARLVFRGTCPYAFIKQVAFARPAAGAARPAPSASWNINSW
jgi:hypothetical protein